MIVDPCSFLRIVVLESPFAGNIDANVSYARACVRDSLRRMESPLAPHLLFTQKGILDDTNETERALGIAAGHQWLAVAKASVVYVDKGISAGMVQGIHAAERAGIPVEYRSIFGADVDAILASERRAR